MINPEDIVLESEEQPPPCATTDIDFYDVTQTADALDLCGVCPMRLQCLETALESQERWGVWGGASQLNLRVALGVDINGDSKQYEKKIRCLNCGPFTTKYLYIIEKKRTGTKIGCSNCGIQWFSRKIINKAQTNW